MAEEHVRLIPRARVIELREMIAGRLPTSELAPEKQDEKEPPIDLNDPELARLFEGLDLTAPKEPNRLPLDVEIFTTFRDSAVRQAPFKLVRYYDGEVYEQWGGSVWVYEVETIPVSYVDEDDVMQFSASPRMVFDGDGNYKQEPWIHEVPSYSTDVTEAKSLRDSVLGIDRLLSLIESDGELTNEWRAELRDCKGIIICSGQSDSCARSILDAVLNALLTDPDASSWYRAV